jgi:hypothetical protein
VQLASLWGIHGILFAMAAVAKEQKKIHAKTRGLGPSPCLD